MLTKCIWCEDEPITIKKNLLGKRCAGYFYRNGTLKSFSGKSNKQKIPYWTELRKRAATIESLIKKYGAEILQDFIALSYRPFWNLVDIGNKYGFTRERARQIHSKLIGKPYREVSNQKNKNIKKEIDSMVCTKDPLYKIAEYKENSSVQFGAQIEQKFLEQCQECGINVDIPCNSPSDFKINGFNVEVKANSKSRLTVTGKSKRYIFPITDNQYKNADFFACYHNKLDTFFIIPKSRIFISKRRTIGGASISFTEEKTNHPLSKNRYWEYKSAWHLLQ